jgi:hypothetical protein
VLVDLNHLVVLGGDDGLLLLDFGGQGLLGIGSARFVTEVATGGGGIDITGFLLPGDGLSVLLLLVGSL